LGRAWPSRRSGRPATHRPKLEAGVSPGLLGAGPDRDEFIVEALYAHFVAVYKRQPVDDEFPAYVYLIGSTHEWGELMELFSPHSPLSDEEKEARLVRRLPSLAAVTAVPLSRRPMALARLATEREPCHPVAEVVPAVVLIPHNLVDPARPPSREVEVRRGWLGCFALEIEPRQPGRNRSVDRGPWWRGRERVRRDPRQLRELILMLVERAETKDRGLGSVKWTPDPLLFQRH
jgi:hypothetical protein